LLKEIDSELIPTSSALRYHGKGNNITHQIRDTVYLIRQASGEFFDKMGVAGSRPLGTILIMQSQPLIYIGL